VRCFASSSSFVVVIVWSVAPNTLPDEVAMANDTSVYYGRYLGDLAVERGLKILFGSEH
jgi:hypothetical protein